MDELKKTLSNIIMTYQNEIQCGMQGEPNFQNICNTVSDMIIELTRFLLDVRYCSRKECACSPEKGIAFLLSENKELFEKYLYKNDLDFLNTL